MGKVKLGTVQKHRHTQKKYVVPENFHTHFNAGFWKFQEEGVFFKKGKF